MTEIILILVAIGTVACAWGLRVVAEMVSEIAGRPAPATAEDVRRLEESLALVTARLNGLIARTAIAGDPETLATRLRRVEDATQIVRGICARIEQQQTAPEKEAARAG